MNATKTLSFTAAEYHMLSLAARGEGKKPEEFLAAILTRFFRAMADLQGIECPVTVTPEHIHRPGLTRQPAEESPAVLSPANFPDVKRLPLPQPPSLTGPGDILDADTIDWTNPNLYK